MRPAGDGTARAPAAQAGRRGGAAVPGGTVRDSRGEMARDDKDLIGVPFWGSVRAKDGQREGVDRWPKFG